MRFGILSCVLTTAALYVGGAASSGDKPKDDKQAKDDIAAVKTYLEKNKVGKSWDVGPTRIDSAEIRKAYPADRFYYVSSTVPGPLITGAAPSPARVEAHRKASEEKMKNGISLTVRINAEGKAVTVDYNAGLMPIKSEADAKLAAAAILALHHESNGPVHVPVGPLSAKDVKVIKSEQGGWSCSVPLAEANLGFSGKFGGTGRVSFDDAGKLTEVAKKVIQVAPYTGPYPPSAPKK